MSLKVTTLVWEHSEQKGNDLIVLLGIAEIANDNGVAWPGRQRLAQKARMSVRGVQGVTERLVAAGELTIHERRGRRNTNIYRVETEALAAKPLRVVAEDENVQSVVKNVQSAEENMQNPPVKHAVATAPEPSVEPQGLEPQSTKEKKAEDERVVFEKWLALCDRDQYTVRLRELSPSRRRLIARALKEATVDECCEALEGLFASSWHKSKGYHDLSHAFGWSPQDKRPLREKIDGHIDEAKRAGAGTRRVTSDQEATLARAKDAVRAQAAYPGNETAQKKGQAAREWLREHGIEVIEAASSDELPTFRVQS
jgi:hypothetical protein